MSFDIADSAKIDCLAQQLAQLDVHIDGTKIAAIVSLMEEAASRARGLARTGDVVETLVFGEPSYPDIVHYGVLRDVECKTQSEAAGLQPFEVVLARDGERRYTIEISALDAPPDALRVMPPEVGMIMQIEIVNGRPTLAVGSDDGAMISATSAANGLYFDTRGMVEMIAQGEPRASDLQAVARAMVPNGNVHQNFYLLSTACWNATNP